jgi:hypothetical protein
MDQFAACWEELDDPRTGNAALPDFNELLVIAFCAVLRGGQGAVDMSLRGKLKRVGWDDAYLSTLLAQF